MGPESWKDEVPPRSAPAGERPPAGADEKPRESQDEREDEGYAQPESSAQKAPPLPGSGQGAERRDPSER